MTRWAALGAFVVGFVAACGGQTGDSGSGTSGGSSGSGATSSGGTGAAQSTGGTGATATGGTGAISSGGSGATPSSGGNGGTLASGGSAGSGGTVSTGGTGGASYPKGSLGASPCNPCIQQACASDFAACHAAPDCMSYLECVWRCPFTAGKTDEACIKLCPEPTSTAGVDGWDRVQKCAQAMVDPGDPCGAVCS